ncbi:MAG: folate family ECF transporter S component [Eubacteriales bacterium]|nr:folate family ECF transporter S component [Eubacteriales bacterium]
MNIIKIFRESFKETKKIRSIVIVGLLLAISIILGRFEIKTPIANIGFSFIANSTAAMLFGPVLSAILGGSTDVLNHIIAPQGSYFFGYTLNAILAGFIYGIFLYRKGFNVENKKALLIRIILAKLLISIFINLGLGTLWTSMFTGKAYIALLGGRMIKEAFTFIINIIVMYIILPIINRLKID